jgi:hypothetical protein
MRRGFTVDEADVVFEYVRVPTRIRTMVSVWVVAGQTAYPQLANLAASTGNQLQSHYRATEFTQFKGLLSRGELAQVVDSEACH